MPTRKKSGPSPGGGRWEKLDSIGDVKRFARWLILSLRARRLDPKEVGAFVQVGNLLARCIEGHDLEVRLKALEAQMENSEQPYEDEDRHRVS